MLYLSVWVNTDPIVPYMYQISVWYKECNECWYNETNLVVDVFCTRMVPVVSRVENRLDMDWIVIYLYLYLYFLMNIGVDIKQKL